jgi:hypothetical protein
MKVTIAQINTTNGDIAGNVAKIIAGIEKAKADGSDIVVFPEVCTHGYTSQDWFQDRDIIEHALEPLSAIIPATVGITAIVGTIRPNTEKDGRRLYNCAAVIPTASSSALSIKPSCPNTMFSTIRAILSRTKSRIACSRSTAKRSASWSAKISGTIKPFGKKGFTIRTRPKKRSSSAPTF